MNYVERHFGDWARDTLHLSILEEGAYNRLVDLYYVREGPLPSDLAACYRLARAMTSAERKAVQSVLTEFFQPTGAGWMHKRCEREIERYRTKSGKASASAKARWDASPNASQNADAKAHANASPNADAKAVRHARAATSSQAPLPTEPSLHPTDAGDSGAAPSAAPPTPPPEPNPTNPPTPPPAFDGLNADALNGRAIVPIAAGFELPADWGTDAMRLGFSADDALREAEKFRQFWAVGKGSGKRRSVKGWRQSWSNWLGKAAARA